MLRFVVGLLIGILLGAGGASLVALGGFEETKVYSVRSISSHYPHAQRDSQTTLVVYREGSSGHVREILCHFPPGLSLPRDETGAWGGIKRVRVGAVAQEYAFGEVGYICEIVE